MLLYSSFMTFYYQLYLEDHAYNAVSTKKKIPYSELTHSKQLTHMMVSSNTTDFHFVDQCIKVIREYHQYVFMSQWLLLVVREVSEDWFLSVINIVLQGTKRVK